MFSSFSNLTWWCFTLLNLRERLLGSNQKRQCRVSIQNVTKLSSNTNTQSSNRAKRTSTRKREFTTFLFCPFNSSEAQRKEWIVYLNLALADLSMIAKELLIDKYNLIVRLYSLHLFMTENYPWIERNTWVRIYFETPFYKKFGRKKILDFRNC